MKTPEGMSEEEVLATINRSVEMLCHSFVFGCYDIDDIRQEAWAFALEAMPRYDPTRPLGNFVYRHIRNRLLNLKRNKHRRNDPPCMLCHRGHQHEHPDGEVCVAYRRWKRRNDTKANLARPGGFEGVADEKETNMRLPCRVGETAECNELLAAIDEKLPPDLRADYLRLRAKEPVPTARRTKVEAAIREILWKRQNSE